MTAEESAGARYAVSAPGPCAGSADEGSSHSPLLASDTPVTVPLLDRLQREVAEERARQDSAWGGVPGIDRRDDHTYAAVLGEEFGEVCKAWLERNVEALRDELIQTAAVALAWVEELDNGGALPRA